MNLFEILQPNRLTEVVDIGANPIDGVPPYKPMLDAGLCRVTGFEPQKEALSELLRNKDVNQRYLPYAIGDGEVHTLHICRGSGMSSLFNPDMVTLDLFKALKPLGDVVQKVKVPTQKLNEITEIEKLDFLKIDIQGGELSVFKNGYKKLADAAVIQTEVSFIALYQDQPTLGEVDLELRTQGFVPHCFAAVKKWPIAPCVVNHNLRQPVNQLLEADMVYVRDFSRPDNLSDDLLTQLALIAHYVYQSVDLALRCVMLLERRSAVNLGAQQTYLEGLSAQGRQ